ncbi:death-associated inhibitor of apoptosis 1-like [Frankliniella occidentalis]|uniref:Death-associated inhibitor of apoptosis 1-like n=1 Tax=Frankliniella occidentalis TaxID=133901 RepID=A0A9C6X240_FRAOC|nr:death-associated inhibitor of apoptosis 1-like [Frankliniella occidentalis]
MDRLRYESERFRTYFGFPIAGMDVRMLTRAGFWFTNNNDKIRCAFCNLEIGALGVGDNLMELHSEWSSDCLFIRGESDNVPMEQEHDMVCLLPSNNCGPCLTNLGVSVSDNVRKSDNVTSTHLNVVRRVEPMHSRFENPKSRLKSYSTWPLEHWLAPRVLSEAGFFYSGTLDKAICFSCGGGLKDWQQHDDPWEEHAFYFSKCRFLIERKGRDFVKRVQGERPRALKSEEIGALASHPPKCTTATPEQFLCHLCQENERKILFMPCGHLVACIVCGMKVKSCPICRVDILATTRAILV